MARKYDIEFHKGEAVTITGEIDPSPTEDISTYTMAIDIASPTPFSKTSGFTLNNTPDVNGFKTWSVGLSSTDTDIAAGTYAWSVTRTNAGSEAVLTYGLVRVKDSPGLQ